MKHKRFSKELWTKIDQAISDAIKQDPQPVAAFDADGTLWDTDLGEAFFRWQIKSQELPGLPDDPWTYYRERKSLPDPKPAYLWLAQINQGQTLEKVRSWAESSVLETSPLPIFEDQKQLIEKLQKSGVKVFIVTASVKWAVEPGARRLQVPLENVLGIETEIENGVVTDRGIHPITYKAGKAEAILKATDGKKPFLCSGNSPGDTQLLSIATHISLAVGATKPGHELFESEEKLRQEARTHKWDIHEF